MTVTTSTTASQQRQSHALLRIACLLLFAMLFVSLQVGTFSPYFTAIMETYQQQQQQQKQQQQSVSVSVLETQVVVDINTGKPKTVVVRDQSALSDKAQVGWAQVESILRVLPTNGNLLVWGLGNDSPFWHGVTTGVVTFLEDDDVRGNSVQGKSWFDFMTELHPQLDAHAVTYTTNNDEATYSSMMKMAMPETTTSSSSTTNNNKSDYDTNSTMHKTLFMSSLPPHVLETKWDVILVDAPVGYSNEGPARFQSLYMTLLILQQSLAKKAAEVASTTTTTTMENNNEAIVHVFVDDYERKVERNFSQKVFGKPPVKVLTRPDVRGKSFANEQAHFVFQKSTHVPWDYKTITSSAGQAENSPLSSPDKWIILLEVNNGFYDFFLNWLKYFEALNITDIKVVVMAEDSTVEGKLKEEVVFKNPNQFSVEQTGVNVDPKAFSFGSRDYKKLVGARATHVLGKLQMGVNVIYADVDAVWRSSPLPYLGATNVADIILQVDSKRFAGHSPYYCTGFMAIVSNDRTISLAKEWQIELGRKSQNNQPIFNDVLHKRSTVRHQGLPQKEFPSGQLYFKSFTPEKREGVVIVHNNFIVGHDAKKKRFQQYGFWNVTAAAPSD